MSYREWKRMNYLKRVAYLPLLGASEAWSLLIRQVTVKDVRLVYTHDNSWAALIIGRTNEGWGELIAQRC